jgi:sugar (pentulose or hexulose) kinase
MIILSADFGTSSLKLSVLNEQNEIQDTAKMEYYYTVTSNDRVELKVDDVFNAFTTGLQKLKTPLQKMDLISFCTFSPSLVAMDRDGEALHPLITHLDRRSRKQTRQVINTMGKDEFRSITGVFPFAGGVSLTSILWIKENLLETFKSTYRFGHLNTYLFKRLTNIWAIDSVNASMTGMYETTSWGSWSKIICSTFGIPVEKLPDIHENATLVGGLTENISKMTGLKQGIPVVLGTNDIAASQVGVGNLRAGDALNVTGSNEMISILSDKPVLSERFYLRNSALKGIWQIFAITAGGLSIDWFRKEFYREMDIDEFYSVHLSKLIKQGPPKTTVGFQPYLAGDRQSLRKKRGGFTGLTLETKRDDLLAAILYGIHEPILKTIEEAEKYISLGQGLKVTGGLANAAMLEFKKRLFARFSLSEVDNATSHGNCALALKALEGRSH